MPAILPVRLTMQVEKLMEHFHQPQAFGRIANEILSLYGDRTQRPGQMETGRSLMPTYNTPGPVLQKILVAFRPTAVEEPDFAMACADALWAFQVAEPRVMAAMMIGTLPTEQPTGQEVLLRLDHWSRKLDDDSLRKRVVQVGLGRLGTEQPKLTLEHAKELIDQGKTLELRIALTMLSALVEMPKFPNLPAVIILTGPLLRVSNSRCNTQLLDLMAALARRSPQESGYLFEQAILSGASPNTLRLVRQVLPELPGEMANRLLVLTQQPRSSY